MVTVNCEGCSAPYDLDPRRIPKGGMKMRCPACDATFMVYPEGNAHARPASASTAATPAAAVAPVASSNDPFDAAHDPFGDDLPSLGGLDLDLPAPKSGAFAGEDGFADLPAPKSSNPSRPASQPTATPPRGPLAPAFPGEVDLPQAKNARTSASDPAAGAELPAVKGPTRTAPPPATEADLPAPKVPNSPRPPRSPGGPRLSPDFPEADLPAPKRSPAPPPGQAPKLSPDFSGADLPAPKSSTHARSGRTDLPAGKAPTAAGPAPSPSDAELPVPRATRPANASQTDLPRPARSAATRRETSPERRSFARPHTGSTQRPQAKAAQPPANRPQAQMPKDSLAIDPQPFLTGELDTSDPFGGLDEPSDEPSTDPHLRQPSGIADGAELPALKHDADLPAVRNGHAELPAVKHGDPPLPAAKRSADLPSPGAPRDLPAPRGETPPSAPASLEARLQARGELDFEAEPPARAPRVPKDSLDIEGFRAQGGQLEPPFQLDDASAPPAAPAPSAATGPSSPRRSTSAELMQGLKLPRSHTGVNEHQGSPALELDDGDFGFADPDPPPALDLGQDLRPHSEPATPAREAPVPPPPARPKAPAPTLDLEEDLESLLVPAEPAAGPSPGAAADPFAEPADSLHDHDPFADLEAHDEDAGALPLDRGRFDAGAEEPLDLGPSGEALDLGLGLDDEPPTTRGRPQPGALGFGEVDLGLGPSSAGRGLDAPPAEADLQLETTGGRGGITGGREREVVTETGLRLDDMRGHPAPARRRTAAWAWVLLAFVLFGGAGAALGQTRYGLFGVYLIERFLPEAGDPAVVAEQIQRAEATAKSDTYVDVRRSLRILSDARMDAGLSHALLARSLLHEALYQLRFGPDDQSAQRAAAILSRLQERTDDAPGMRLAQAAHAAASGDLDGARSQLEAARDPNDPYTGLVRGEVALRREKGEAALEAFEQAAKAGAGARAQYGVLRAELLTGDLADARRAAAKTLEESPLHADARIQQGVWALADGDLEAAEELLLQSVGWRKVGEERVSASRDQRADAWTLLGQVHERRGHVNQAFAAYDRALKSDAMRMQALLGSGRALLTLSRPREALSRFEAALNAKPGKQPDANGRIPAVEATVGAARALLRLDETDRALEQLKADPALAASADIRLWLGHAYEQKDEHAAAEEYFRKSIEAAPRQLAGYLGLAQMLFSEKRPEEAARTLEEARQHVEDGADMRRMLGQSELARNHVEAALEQFQAALRFDPNNPGALSGMATAQRRQGKLDEALATLDRVESLDPKFPGLALERGRVHEARGRYDQAVEVYERALAQREGDLDLQLQMGAALVAAGQIDRAEQLLSQVLKERPTSAQAEHFMGRVVFARRDSAQAVVHFQRAVNLDMTEPTYHMYLAWAQLESGNFAGALEAIEVALRRDPTLGDAHWIEGRVQLRMGAVKDAIESFQRALSLSPGRTEALADMGDAYDELRKLRSAVKAYEEAVERDPERGAWWYRLGELRLDRGDRSEAIEALSQAVLLGDRQQVKPAWLASAHRIYADALHRKDQDELALEHYQVYLALAPEDALDRENVEALVRRLQR